MLNYRSNDMASTGFAISPSNSAAVFCYGLFIGTGGDIKVDMIGEGSAVIFKNIPDGTFLPIAVKKVYATDTSADDIVGLK